MNQPVDSQTSFQVNYWHYDPRSGSLTRIKGEPLEERVQAYTSTLLLGSGISGDVYKFTANNSRDKAIKFSIVGGSVKNEYEISLLWPKYSVGLLIQPKAYFSNTMRDFFVMHLYGGTLRDILETLDLKKRVEVLYQLSHGLVTLHDLNISHEDIHLQNIFYDERKNRYDLADFGLSKRKETFNNFSLENDLMFFYQTMESILIGCEPPAMNLLEPYKRRINHLDDILKLGFDEEPARLILELIESPDLTARQYLEAFSKIKNLMK